MIRGRHQGWRWNCAQQMNVETNAFGRLHPEFGGYTGDPPLTHRPNGGAIHDQTFWRYHRTPLEALPSPSKTTGGSRAPDFEPGLAWAFVTPITEDQNRQANFDFATGRLLVAGTAPTTGCTICVPSDGRVGIQLDKTALEPRIGLAWKPFGRQNTAIRLGYAIFHDSSWNQGAQGNWENPPYLAESDNFSGLCSFQNLNLRHSRVRHAHVVFFLPSPRLKRPPDFPGNANHKTWISSRGAFNNLTSMLNTNCQVASWSRRVMPGRGVRTYW